MKWFGATWGAPACRPSNHVETPIGEECARCKRRIAETDQGFVMPLIVSLEDVGARVGVRAIAFHRACLMAAILPCKGCEICRGTDRSLN